MAAIIIAKYVESYETIKTDGIAIIIIMNVIVVAAAIGTTVMFENRIEAIAKLI